MYVSVEQSRFTNSNLIRTVRYCTRLNLFNSPGIAISISNEDGLIAPSGMDALFRPPINYRRPLPPPPTSPPHPTQHTGPLQPRPSAHAAKEQRARGPIGAVTCHPPLKPSKSSLNWSFIPHLLYTFTHIYLRSAIARNIRISNDQTHTFTCKRCIGCICSPSSTTPHCAL